MLPFSSPGDLPDSGIEARSPALQADSLPTELCYEEAHMPHSAAKKKERERERETRGYEKEGIKDVLSVQQKISSRPSKQKCRGPRPTVESPLCGENGSLGEG